MKISVNDKTLLYSRGFLFIKYKEGIIGYGRKDSDPSINILWKSDTIDAELAVLMRDHPELYQYLPRKFKSNASIKSAALLSSLEKPKEDLSDPEL